MMKITVTPEQEALIEQALKTGRLDRPEDALTEALLLWEEREALRLQLIGNLEAARCLGQPRRGQGHH